ncbi:hypothetical protein C4D60_Mb07t15190 [Musa balbisiana]|uniref:Uncharacterized protein n=1 Tax=Musa balbisiana TaxID=52838 RepID=A0A4V4H6P1_MUSBA|nr:hypothetical protein C4D60_Mb07t15190 [Musa balbisiana]
MAFETHLRGLPACVVLLDPMTRDTPARPTRLRRVPRSHVARDHACAACPPAPCSSIARWPRPRLRGLPACIVFLGYMAFETHLRSLPACAVFLGRTLPETTPARPARLRRVPRLHGLRDTPARPARLRRAPRPHDPRHTCAANPPVSCSSVTCCPRPRLRGLPACAVFLDCTLPETTPARPARLRRVPRLHAPRDHTCTASPPASCSSAPRLHAPRDRIRAANPPEDRSHASDSPCTTTDA